MYQPAHFVESRPEVLRELIRLHPLGLLITHGPDGLAANTIPFLFEPATGATGTAGTSDTCGQLVGHVARANPLWKTSSPDYLDAMLRAIVCIEVAVDKLEGKWKVSQNQPVANRAGVITGLHAAGGDAAAAMARLVDNRSVDN